jgi:hypothetical protein
LDVSRGRDDDEGSTMMAAAPVLPSHCDPRFCRGLAFAREFRAVLFAHRGCMK